MLKFFPRKSAGTDKCRATRGLTDKPRAPISKHTCNRAAINIMATEHKHRLNSLPV